MTPDQVPAQGGVRERQERAQGAGEATAAQQRHRRKERAFSQESPRAQLSKATVGTEGVKVQKSQQATPGGTAGADPLQSACPRGARRSKLRENPTMGEPGSAGTGKRAVTPTQNLPWWYLQHHHGEQHPSPCSLSTKRFIGLQCPGR